MTSPGSFLPGDVLTADDLNGIGVWQSYTPVLTQSVTRTATVNHAEYCLINKLCYVNVDLTCTTTGSNATARVSLPFNNVSLTTTIPFGVGIFFDSSASTTTVFAVAPSATLGTVGITNTSLGNNDVISFSLAYQVT
jgi:hypothetical protein